MDELQQLKAAHASAAELLAAATHEVKTPLTVVLGALRLLQHHADNVDAEQREMLLSMAVRRTRDVARLVDGVLHTVRNELAPDVPRRSLLVDVIEEATSGLEFGADVAVDEVGMISLAVDAATARSILGSLLDDALGREGTVMVTVTPAEASVGVTVRNTTRSLAELMSDDGFAPATTHADVAPPTAGLHLAALLCGASRSRLEGGVAGNDAHFTVHFPTV